MSERRSMIPESYLLAYEKYMRYKTGDPLCGIMHNHYIDAQKQEGYKLHIAAETRSLTEKAFGTYRDKRPDDAAIIGYANAILDKCSNLVVWRVINTVKGIINDTDKQRSAAAVIHAVMCSADAAKAYKVPKAVVYRLAFLFSNVAQVNA